MGGDNQVTATLTTTAGNPINDQTVVMRVNGITDRRARTDANGTVTLSMKQQVNAGPVKITLLFEGSSQYNPTSIVMETEVKPGVLEIPVVPVVEGVVLKLDDTTAVSGADGIVRFPMTKSGEFKLTFPEQPLHGAMQINFHRWSDENFTTEREVEFPLKRPFSLGLDLSYYTQIQFFDPDGLPVPNERIKSYTIKGSNGTPYTFTDFGPHLLPASRVIRRSGGLQETKILYSVMDVQVDGSNVVIQAQQRFYLQPEDLWRIDLLFYTASFTGRDALFGFPAGNGIDLHFPDGRVETFAFTEDNIVSVEKLARGEYQVRLTNAKGYTPLTPIALSRNQEVDLMVVSYLDMATGLGLGLFLAIGLILIGRPKILRALTPVRLFRVGKKGGAAVYPSMESREVR